MTSSARLVSSASCVAQITAAPREARGADEQTGDERGALLVEPRGRLVEQDDVGTARERARDRDALALARREAVGGAVDAIGEAEALEPGARLGLVLRRAPAVVDLLGEQHVLERRGEGHEARLLADPADVVAAVRGEGLAVELAESAPATVTEPASGRSRPAMRCSSVVLPEPERPSTATSRPRVNAASKPDRTWCARAPVP